MYSSSTVNRFGAKSDVSNDRFYKEKAAFIDKNNGTFAFKGNDPFGNWYFMR
jgi:hypothetical protein